MSDFDILFFISTFNGPFIWLAIPTILGISGIIYNHKDVSLVAAISVLMVIYNVIIILSIRTRKFQMLYSILLLLLGLIIVVLFIVMIVRERIRKSSQNESQNTMKSIH